MDTKFRGTPLLLQAQLSNAALPISRSFLSAPAPRATCPVRLAGGSIASTATALCASDVDLQNSRLAACVEAAGDMGLAGTSSPAAASPRGPWRVADASTDGQHSVFGWQTQYKGVAQYAAAGVMPFAYRQADGELYVLLSLQRTRRRVKQAEEEAEAAAPAAGPARQTLAYTFLGGKVEVGDGGDARVTAAREAHEETHRLLHTEQVREALCGRPHGRMVADEAHMPSGSGSSISPGSSSSGTTVASDARSAGAGSGGPDLPAPYMYFPSGRYTLFALHLPDAWRLPQACQAKLQAGETHPEADKVLGLEWVSLRQLGSIKQGNAQYVTLGRGLPGSSRNGVPSRAAPKNASNGLAQPATATSTTAAPEAASAPERPSAATSDSAGTATVTGGSATSSPASGVAPSGPASGVAASGPASGSGSGSSGAGGGQGEAGADCSARAHHFLADILRNKRMSVGVHGWLLCMRRHMRQWHGFQGARPDETAEEEEALAKAARLALGLADVDDDRFVDDGGADSDGEGQEAASAAPGGLEQLFSELPSSLQVSSQGADTRAAEKPRQRAEAEEASRVRVHQHIVERDVQRTALAKATEAARAALPMRRPPPPLLPLPVVVPPASVLASRLPMPMPRMPLPVPPPPAALPRPSPSLVSAAAPPASAARAGAAASTSTSTSTRTSTSAQSPSYTVWCMDGSPDSHTGQPPPAETRLRLQPVANARGPSGRPDTGGQGPWQASARSPHQSGHAQEAAISTSTSTSAQAPLVTVWRMDGTPDSRVGEPPPAETRLRLQPAANARDASFRPGTGGKGQEQASVSSPHQSGHAQGSPAVVASTQGGGETEEVVVWRMDGGVQWGTSGGAHGASAATVLKQRSGFGDAGAMGAAGSKPARKVADLRAAGRREARE